MLYEQIVLVMFMYGRDLFPGASRCPPALLAPMEPSAH